MKVFFTYLLFLCFAVSASFTQEVLSPDQATEGPGSSEYLHDTVRFIDSAQTTGGFWLFLPGDPQPDTTRWVVFLHGFGCYNPMIYGKWLKHLARKGNVVIMPRYQQTLFVPRTCDFTDQAARAIRKAIQYIEAEQEMVLIFEKPVFIGHSYGGVLATNLCLQYASWGIPQPKAMMLCQPGTGLLRAGLLPEYSGFPDDLKLLVLVSRNDRTVRQGFVKGIYGATLKLHSRNVLRIAPDRHGFSPIDAGHRSCYATDTDFDNGVRTRSARYALSHIPADAADYYGYWKLADALIDCTHFGKNCDTAFGGTEAQLSLGVWSDGKPVRSLRIMDW